MTENINGIQVDISKYVGEEIARLAVASMSSTRMPWLGTLLPDILVGRSK